ncbi:MAG: hypothetical protein IKZ88_07240 [Neisseriaceae bacterium]|nr:hypothetical protein [Neisseriaceae bacterium]MBR5676428.1 hypothetical protein [Neisseriaceae bacterium]MBR5941038.1 hypothetical protein [Neisseriaceae bacterium]
MNITKFKIWLTLIAHIVAFGGVLLYQEITLNHTAQISNIVSLFLQKFNTHAAQLLAAFLILAPLWAVFITRKNKIYGNFIFILTLIWYIILILFCSGSLKNIEPWLSWILYAVLMILLGMFGVLYAVFTEKTK